MALSSTKTPLPKKVIESKFYIDNLYIKEEQLLNCKLFADRWLKKNPSLYSGRNQSIIKKIKKDIVQGKVAEWMVYNKKKDEGYIVTEPDMNIYENYQKSYDADLLIGEYNIHIKSYISNERYPTSWQFTINDQLITKPNDNDFLVLISFDSNYNNAYGYKLKASSKKVNYRNPMKKSLIDYKRTIYESDIIKSIK